MAVKGGGGTYYYETYEFQKSALVDLEPSFDVHLQICSFTSLHIS